MKAKSFWAIVAVLLAIMARGQTTLIDSLRQAEREFYHENLDSLCRAIHETYPLGLLDSTALERECLADPDSIWYGKFSVYEIPQLRLQEILEKVCGPAAALQDLLVIETREVIVFQTYDHRIEKEIGFIWLGWSGYEDAQASLADRFLDAQRDTEGFIIDLRRPLRLKRAEAIEILGRFLSTSASAFTARERVRGTTEYRDTLLTVKPRGDWQYERPVVILVDSTSIWPAQMMVEVLKQRRYVSVVGQTAAAPRGVEPVPVDLPGEIRVWIPSAVALTRKGKYLGAIKPDVKVPYNATPEEFREHGIRELKDLIRRYKREREDRMEEMLRK